MNKGGTAKSVFKPFRPFDSQLVGNIGAGRFFMWILKAKRPVFRWIKLDQFFSIEQGFLDDSGKKGGKNR
ncbi:hypothetical protein RKD52_001232 [Metabacillus sp. SLBN-84]